MNISSPIHDNLVASLTSKPIAAIAQLKPDIKDITLTEALQEQARTLEQLLAENQQRIEARKAVNASIGKTRRAGGDIAPIIEKARQMTMDIDKHQVTIDLLASRIADQCASLDDDTQNTTGNAGKNNPAIASGLQDSQGNDPDQPKRPGQFQPCCTNADIAVDTLSIRDDINPSAWNAYVAKNPRSTHYHQHQWRELLIQNFDQRTYYLAACDAGDNIVGIVTAVHLKSMVVGSCMLSTPFLIYGGPVADTPEVGALLVDHLESIAHKDGCEKIQLRETQPREGWQCDKNKVSMVLALPTDLETLNRRFGSKLRSQVKRATREQPTFTIGGAEQLTDFYKVFSRKMRDHGTPVYARRFFRDILETFPDSTRIAVVHLRGKPVAAAFLVRYRDTMEIPWAASHRSFDRLGMNMFMYHQLLEHAVSTRCQFFDFGRSTLASETWRFKKQWGATEQQLYWHSRSMNAASPAADTATHEPTVHAQYDTDTSDDENSDGRAMQLAVSTWKYLPVPVANTIGPILARQLPW